MSKLYPCIIDILSCLCRDFTHFNEDYANYANMLSFYLVLILLLKWLMLIRFSNANLFQLQMLCTVWNLHLYYVLSYAIS